MKTFALAALSVVLAPLAAGADPMADEPQYRATYDAERDRYCVVRLMSPSGPARAVGPGPRCRSRSAWQQTGLRIDHPAASRQTAR